MPNTLEKYKSVLAQHIKRLQQQTKNLELYSLQQYCDFLKRAKDQEDRRVFELELKKSDLATFKKREKEVSRELQQYQQLLKEKEDTNIKLIDLADKTANTLDNNREIKLSILTKHLKECAISISKLEEIIRKKSALLSTTATKITDIENELSADNINHEEINVLLRTGHLISHALRVVYNHSPKDKLYVLLLALHETDQVSDLIAHINQVAESNGCHELTDLSDNELLEVSDLIKVDPDILHKKLRYIAHKVLPIYSNNHRFYNYLDRKEKIETAIKDFSTLLGALTKQDFDMRFAFTMDHLENQVKAESINEIKNEIEALQKEFHEQTSFQKYHDDYLNLVTQFINIFSENKKPNSLIKNVIGFLSTMQTHLKQDHEQFRKMHLVNYLYEDNLCVFLYELWANGFKDFDQRVFAMEICELGVEQEINYEELNVPAHGMETKYKEIQKRYDIDEATAQNITNLFACLKQKHQQLAFVEKQNSKTPAIEHYIERQRTLITNLSNKIFTEIARLEVKLEKASDTIFEYECAANVYLQRLEKAQGKKTKGEKEIDELLENKIRAMREIIAPLDKKTRDPIAVLDKFSNLVNGHKYTLIQRRDNFLMSFIKCLGPLGESLYQSIVRNDFFQKHVFFKPHGARFVEQAELETARVKKMFA